MRLGFSTSRACSSSPPLLVGVAGVRRGLVNQRLGSFIRSSVRIGAWVRRQETQAPGFVRSSFFIRLGSFVLRSSFAWVRSSFAWVLRSSFTWVRSSFGNKTSRIHRVRAIIGQAFEATQSPRRMGTKDVAGDVESKGKGNEDLDNSLQNRFHQTPDKFGAITIFYSDILDSLNFQMAY
nr:hypothetical protein CFP56_71401 [Quercus suber]